MDGSMLIVLFAVEDIEARLVPLGERRLGDLARRELEVEIGGAHARANTITSG